MKVTPLWSRFNLGEVSPRLWSVNQVASQALAKVKNAIVTSQGSVRRRGGFRNLGNHERGFSSLTVDRADRLIPLFIADKLEFQVAFIARDSISTSYEGRAFNEFGKFYRGEDNEIDNGVFAQQDTGWSKSTSDVIVETGAITLIKSYNTDTFIDRDSETFSATTDFVIMVDLEMPDGDVNCRIDVDDLGSGQDETWAINKPGRVVRSWTWNNSATQVNIEISNTTYINDDGVKEPRLIVRGVYLFPDFAGNPPSNIVFGTLNIDDVENLHYEQVPGENKVYMFSAGSAPKELAWNDTLDRIDLADISFTGAPAEWTPDNYPGAGGFFQGRLWLGGTISQPERFYASQSGDYDNFTQDVNPDDGFEFDIAKKGGIKWFLGLRNMLCGTTRNEFILTSDTGVLNVGDLQVELQSAHGSRIPQPVSVGNSAIFVSGDASKIRSSFYRWEEDAWKTRDVTYLAEHIFGSDGEKVKRIVYQKHPERILWVLSNTGQLYGCTFDDSLEFVGWHRHDTEDEIMDISVSDSGGKSELFAIIRRPYSDSKFNQNRSIEILDRNVNTDGAVIFDSPDAINGFEDLTHLHSSTNIFTKSDGNIVDSVTIATDGTITGAPASFDCLEVGKGYTMTIRTLPMDFAVQSGNTPSYIKKFVTIFVRMVRPERAPKINGDRGESFFDNDDQIDIHDYRVNGNKSHDLHASILIEQDLPYDCEIISVFGELEQNNR